MNTYIRSSVKSLVGFSVAAALATSAHAALTFTIPAPNGVGDVVALTNAFQQLDAAGYNGRMGARVWLEPGVYDLSGVYMESVSHLLLQTVTTFLSRGSATDLATPSSSAVARLRRAASSTAAAATMTG